MHQSIGLAAGVISLVATALYIIAIRNGTTRPNRATWWILTFVGFLVAESYHASGASFSTMCLAWAYALGSLAIATLSIFKKYGVGGWEGLDKWCLCGVVISLALRIIFSNHPTQSLVFNLMIDFLGLVPTFIKAWRDPLSEDKVAWIIGSAASLLNILAVDQWKFAIYVHPVYFAISNTLLTLILFRRSRIKKSTTK